MLAVLVVIWRPLAFDSPTPSPRRRARARALLSAVFMLLLGLTIAIAVQIIVLLVLALLVTRRGGDPGLVLRRRRPAAVGGLRPVSALGGILLAIGSTLPVSPFITTISFAIYLACRVIAAVRARGTAVRVAA